MSAPGRASAADYVVEWGNGSTLRIDRAMKEVAIAAGLGDDGTPRVLRHVVIKSDGVGNLKVAVDGAIEAGCIAGMAKLRRWGFTDWANECHGCAYADPIAKKEGRY